MHDAPAKIVEAPQRPPSRRHQVLAFAVLCSICVVIAIGYVAWTAARSASPDRQPQSGEPAPRLAAPPVERQVLFRSTELGEGYGKLAVAQLDRDGNSDGARYVAPLSCERVHFAAGRGICLTADRGVLTTYGATIFDAEFRPLHTLDLSGIPSRARISPDGRYAAMTAFVSGHSYDSSGFSTRTTVVDTTSGELVLDLEDLTVLRDGAVFTSVDFNFWGVTFAVDSDRFYATLGTGGRTYLIEGDLVRREARVVYEGLECPSLSPDNTRVAFKKQVGDGGRTFWQPRILDLATLTETALAGETRSVDDQMEWLDDEHIVYGLPDDVATATAASNLWVLAADGTGTARRLLAQAASPAIVR